MAVQGRDGRSRLTMGRWHVLLLGAAPTPGGAASVASGSIAEGDSSIGRPSPFGEVLLGHGSSLRSSPL
uniref:Putative secreted peptide n=1 Tax=Anopheles braziliensis TaxID=58242 RepID=A0A2M3ZU62_9DIPT